MSAGVVILGKIPFDNSTTVDPNCKIFCFIFKIKCHIVFVSVDESKGPSSSMRHIKQINIVSRRSNDIVFYEIVGKNKRQEIIKIRS